jgi:hypothetical protein
MKTEVPVTPVRAYIKSYTLSLHYILYRACTEISIFLEKNVKFFKKALLGVAGGDPL